MKVTCHAQVIVHATWEVEVPDGTDPSEVIDTQLFDQPLHNAIDLGKWEIRDSWSEKSNTEGV